MMQVSTLPPPLRIVPFVCLLLCASAVFAQDQRSPGTEAPNADRHEQWAPIGRIPVDQAGEGLRGYALAGESTEVAQPGAHQITVHAVASNNFYREQNDRFSITQRYETHTMALGFRRGFKVAAFPRFELGGQVQVVEADNGFMNGFISGTENFLTWVSGQKSATNLFRRSGAHPPLGTVVTRDGRPLYQAAGDGAGFGDLSIVAKALVRDGDIASSRTQVAARISMNVSGKSEFAGGNFAGVGVSLDKKILPWTAFHGDLRATYFLDRVSLWNLPLKHAALGFSVGPEFKLSRDSSASAQLDGNTTPYMPTGATAFDRGYGAITLGASHRFQTQRHQVVTQAYLRENMNLPFRVRWNTDPDLSLGIKITIHSTPRASP